MGFKGKIHSEESKKKIGDDDSFENLQKVTKEEHTKIHNETRERDTKGRYTN